jgi:hypothetical protein
VTPSTVWSKGSVFHSDQPNESNHMNKLQLTLITSLALATQMAAAQISLPLGGWTLGEQPSPWAHPSSRSAVVEVPALPCSAAS